MRAARRPPESGEWPEGTATSEMAFAEVTDPMPKWVVSSNIDVTDWNAELVVGNVIEVVNALKEAPGVPLSTGRVIDDRVLLLAYTHHG